ncbi:hypothetical protein NY78_0051 [Desulfovibrio sp. TomC]|nr:hypothetical protein NY78_0051 [Desulfovibrio sp. TomC]
MPGFSFFAAKARGPLRPRQLPVLGFGQKTLCPEFRLGLTGRMR